MNYILKIQTFVMMFIFACMAGKGQTAKADETVNSQSVYEKLDKGEDVNILILGDSIGISSHASDTEHSWVYQMEQSLEERYGSGIYINNMSMNGNISYSEYVRAKALKDGVNYDLAILCVGENDSVYEFSPYYEALIRAVAEKYKNCQIISVLQSSQTYESEKIQKTIALCEHYDIPMADTIAAFAQSGIPYEQLSSDGIHPNDTGYEIYTNTVVGLIDSLVNSDTVHACAKNMEPLDTDAADFSGFSYYSVKDFSYDGKNTYDIDVSNVSGTLGLDFGIIRTDCVTEVYVDGELQEQNVSLKNIRRYITPVGKISAKTHIKIVISNDVQASLFCGMIISGSGNPPVNNASFLTQPKITGAKNTSLGVKVMWEPEENVTGYAIYRKNLGSEVYHKIGSVYSGDTDSYIDMKAKSGKTYTYAVRAVRDDVPGFYEPGIKNTYIASPELNLKNDENSVKLSWNKINGAKEYIVYRKEYGGKWLKIREVKGKASTQCHDYNVESNTLYMYCVKAVNSAIKSEKSKENAITYVQVPVMKKLQNTKSGIKVRWNEVDGADRYYLYRKTGNGRYKLVKKLNDIDNTCYTDTKVKTGKTYSYMVKAEIDGSSSCYSKHKSIRREK